MTKKMLITGINGFIGSKCEKYFTDKGWKVFGIDIFGKERENLLIGEVDLDNLKSFEQKFDAIIHLAGSGTVGSAQSSPELEFAKTVGSSKHVLDFIRYFNPEAKLIYSSSAAVYGNCSKDTIAEDAPLEPISIYGEHKVMVEKLCERYYRDYNLDINIIRFFSIYGEGLKKQLLWDFSNRVIDNINCGDIMCFGSGEESRDFIHIDDALCLIEILINNKEKFAIVNAGTSKKISVNQIQKLICAELNYTGALVYDKITRKGNPDSIVANIEKARKMGFTPKVEINDGIKRYISWLKKCN